MAAGHRTANRAKAKAQRAKDRRRADKSHTHVSAWLGAGALTLGVGAALASGAAVASAAPQHTGHSASSASSSGSGSADASPGNTSSPAAAKATRPSRPSGAKKNTNTKADPRSDISSATTNPATTDLGRTNSKAGTAAQPSSDTSSATTNLATADGGRTTHKTGITAEPGSSPDKIISSAVKTVASSTVGTTRAVSHAAAVPSDAALTGAAIAPESLAAPVVSQAARPVVPGPLLPRVLNLVEALLGVNPGVTPDPHDTVKIFLYGFFTRLQQRIDPAPAAGTPIVGAADPTTGKVTGAANFTTTPDDDVTYSAPTTSTGGAVISVVASTGVFTYTPSAAQRLAAVAGTTDTFVITAHDDLLTSTVTITVPVDAGTPVAKAPVAGDPDRSTGTVTGNAVFTDPAGRPLTFTGPNNGTSVGGGTVTVDPTTGAYTYTPTPAQRFQGTFNTDIFTITASNGVHSTTQTVTVPISQFSSGNEVTVDFFVTNLSSQPVEYGGISSNKDGNSLQDQPAVGSILQPGESQRFSLVNWFLGDSAVTAVYVTPNDPNSDGPVWNAQLEYDGYASTGCTGASCSTGSSAEDDQNLVYLLDPPGTVNVLPATDPTGQAAALEKFCVSNSASCTFKATSQTEAFGARHPVGNEVENDSSSIVTTTVSISDAVAATDSIGLSTRASGGIAGIVNLEISATYGHTWTTTNTFIQTVTVTAAPHTIVQIVAEQPVYRVTGDFTIVMGNTTYLVQGVTFDSPNPNGQGRYIVTDRPSPPITLNSLTPTDTEIDA